jgi:hypothetical protein
MAMASGHIHMQAKFSNKLVNHTVETKLIHTNTKTHHIYLIKRHNTPIKQKNKDAVISTVTILVISIPLVRK